MKDTSGLNKKSRPGSREEAAICFRVRARKHRAPRTRPPPVRSTHAPRARIQPHLPPALSHHHTAMVNVAAVVLAVRVAANVLEGVLRTLCEVNERLGTYTDKSNKRLSASLDAFIIRVNGERIENRAPSDKWLRELENLGNDIDVHAAKCERHATETSSMPMLNAIRDSLRARKLRKEVKQLISTMDFAATTATTTTTASSS